ncbi:MAG TPA: hypothetical protein VFO79_11125 [Xanthomonadales bacterium]|nr:hypothetical protein [Xanthomonadales bacterium]
MIVTMLLSTALAAAATTPAADAPLAVERLVFATGPKAAQPSVAVDPREGFVVTWQERDGEDSALRYAVIARDGAELRRGTVSSGPDRFVNGADFPSLAVLDNGDWVTYWLQKTAKGTYAYEIRMVRSRDAGRSWDAPIVPHRDGTPTEHGFVSMVPAGDDRVRVVWLDGRRMAASADAHGEGGDEHMTLRAAVIGRDGQATDEHELDELTCACCQTDMVRGDSATLAAYRDRTGDELRDVAVLAHAKGAWSAPALAHADGWKMPACPVNGPALARQGDRYAVVWPTMASGEMQVMYASGRDASFGKAVELAAGPGELGRVDAGTWGGEHLLVSRIATDAGVPALWLSEHDRAGRTVAATKVASPVGGYPRLAHHDAVTLLAWTEPVSGSAGATRVGIARITARRAAD